MDKKDKKPKIYFSEEEMIADRYRAKHPTSRVSFEFRRICCSKKIAYEIRDMIAYEKHITVHCSTKDVEKGWYRLLCVKAKVNVAKSCLYEHLFDLEMGGVEVSYKHDREFNDYIKSHKLHNPYKAEQIICSETKKEYSPYDNHPENDEKTMWGCID